MTNDDKIVLALIVLALGLGIIIIFSSLIKTHDKLEETTEILNSMSNESTHELDQWEPCK